ncbi:hypothetical protein RDI58_003646 [Solanum bulbocastanum]|uniref:RRM domain-containing protein n=1 Tax=Solanum bulbocastanum TaxID=147425 RepID=A0AAN8YSB5_SOLBU
MANVPESSLNPDAPEYIPIPTLAPRPRPRPRRRPMYMLLPVHQYLAVILPTHQFLAVMLPTHQFLPLILSTHPYSPALQPHPYPIVDSPQENVRRRRQRRSIPPRVGGLERRISMNETTVMIKNIPFDYEKNRIRGYAFVNFTDQRTLWNFFLAFSDGVKAFPDSARSVKIATAYIQGKNYLRRRYQYARFRSEAIGFYPPRDGSQIIASGEI